MSEPTDHAPHVPPDVSPDAALIALIRLLYTDPLAEPLTDEPGFFVNRLGLSIRYGNERIGGRQLEAARGLFGGTVADDNAYRRDAIGQVLTTSWQGHPLRVYVQIPREDELTELRKRLAQYEPAESVAE
jgi:hypothetical protein